MSASGRKMLAFAKRYGTDMIAALEDTGIFFPIMLCQASVESGYGGSASARNKNNFFGIMAGKTTKRFLTKKECFHYYANLFSTKDNYIKNNIAGQIDPFKQLRAIANSGYYSCNNDTPSSLPARLRAKYPHVSAKESADHYYNTIKPFLSEILLSLPIGKISNSQDTAMAINQIQSATV